MQPVQRPSAPRQAWIDVLRGASVLLVVLAHAHHFAVSAEGASAASALSPLLIQAVGTINKLFAPLRMELMFLLSGLFVAHGLTKGPARYLSGKFRNVLYPFLLWCLVNFVVREGGSAVIKGEPVAWQTLIDLLAGIAAPTWFLFDLFLFFLLIPLLRRYPAWMVIAATVAMSVILDGAGWSHYGEMAYYFAYFVAGDLIARRGWNPATRWGGVGVIASALCLGVLGVVALTTSLSKTWWGYLPLVLASLPAIVALAMLAARSPLSAPLAYVGRNSVVFHLVHFTLFIVLTFLASRLIHDDVVLFFVLLAAGIALPAALSWARAQPSMRMLDLLFCLPPSKRTTAMVPARERVAFEAGLAEAERTG